MPSWKDGKDLERREWIKEGGKKGGKGNYEGRKDEAKRMEGWKRKGVIREEEARKDGERRKKGMN